MNRPDSPGQAATTNYRAGVSGQTLPPEAPDHDVRGVLALPDFRKLWISLTWSSFGDWLGLLATTAMAAELGGLDSYLQANLAVSAVLLLRMVPSIVFGPVAGVVVDRFDRKRVMVVGDVLRGAIYVSIPVVGTLPWLFVATVLSEIVGLFWTPAKDASVPNMVPRRRLEAANQLSLASTYGSAPVSALAFSALALLTGVVHQVIPSLHKNDLALYVDALTYFYAAWVVARLSIPGGHPEAAGEPVEHAKEPGFFRTLMEGWRFVGGAPQIRGLVLGMLGAFGAGGFVIGVAPSFSRDLGAGSAGYGILFGAVFTGLAGGMWLGPRTLSKLPRWRLFALSLSLAGVFLALVALISEIVLASLFTVLVGVCGGIAWVTGYTMLGSEVEDSLRGRTFAFVQSAARVVLVGVMALAPAMSAWFGTHHWRFSRHLSLTMNGTAITLFVAALLAVAIGFVAYRNMDDHGEVSLREDLWGALRPETVDSWWATRRTSVGLFIAFEGGDGAGKSTQVAALRDWAVSRGHEVVVTREPGATALGAEIRSMVLHHEGELCPRTETLLFAADRAQHLATVIRPALDRGSVVVTDRFVDSSVAYQGAGRGLGEGAVADVSAFATDGARPDLTILLDLDPELVGERLAGRGEAADRIEREDDAFRRRVRAAFLHQARVNPRRYMVIDASASPQRISEQIQERLADLLPPNGGAYALGSPSAPGPLAGAAVTSVIHGRGRAHAWPRRPGRASAATVPLSEPEPGTGSSPITSEPGGDEWNQPYEGR